MLPEMAQGLSVHTVVLCLKDVNFHGGLSLSKALFHCIKDPVSVFTYFLSILISHMCSPQSMFKSWLQTCPLYHYLHGIILTSPNEKPLTSHFLPKLSSVVTAWYLLTYLVCIYLDEPLTFAAVLFSFHLLA